MAKMIIVGTRVSEKYSKLVENCQGPNFRRVYDCVLGNVIKSAGSNKYEVKFGNGVIKEVISNSLHIEKADSGIPIEEAAPVLEPVSSVENDEIVSNSSDSNEWDDILFLMDSARLDLFNNSDNKCDSNDEIEINTGDMNLPADALDTNNTSSISNQLQLVYHQKLKVK